MVDGSSEHKKAKGVNKYVVEKLTHCEINVLLTKKCLRHSMNRVQREKDNVGTYEIKIYLSCFYDKIYTLKSGYDGLALGY